MKKTTAVLGGTALAGIMALGTTTASAWWGSGGGGGPWGPWGGGPWYDGKGGKLSDDRSMSGINLVEIRPVTPATKGN